MQRAVPVTLAPARLQDRGGWRGGSEDRGGGGGGGGGAVATEPGAGGVAELGAVVGEQVAYLAGRAVLVVAAPCS